MILPNIENFIGCDSSFEEAEIVLYGAPFDSPTSFRPGARCGPSAIRHDSCGLELCFGSSEKALADIQDRAEEILKEGKMPLLLGGEHLVTLADLESTGNSFVTALHGMRILGIKRTSLLINHDSIRLQRIIAVSVKFTGK